MRSWVIVFAIAILSCTSSSAVPIQTWNAYTDYSAGNMLDPWGYVYQYGTAWDGTYNFNNMSWSEGGNSWYAPMTPLNNGYQCGAWANWSRLVTNSCKLGDTGLNPGQGFLSFTAPRSGNYTISGNTFSYAGVSHSGKAFITSPKYGQLWSAVTPEFDWSTTYGFNITKDLAAGDTLYFGCDVINGAGTFQSCPQYWLATVDLNSTSGYHESWSAFNDFNPDSNPAHNFSYVYQSGATWNGSWNFTSMTKSTTYPGWWEAPNAPYNGVPQVGATSEWSRVKLNSCRLGGGGKTPALGLLQWTAPECGYFRFTGSAYIYPSTNTKLFVYCNRTYSAILSVNATTQFTEYPFDQTILLNKGDRLVFGSEPITGVGTYGCTTSYWTVNVSRVAYVPPPWTAITTNGNSVSCWNRTYDFSNKVFPNSITVGGVNILSGPIELVAKVGGVKQNWGAATYTLDETASDVVKMITSATAGNLKVTCRTKFEYDGFMLFNVTLKPTSGSVTLSSLDLKIPYNSSYAKLFHHDPIKDVPSRNWATDTINCGAIPGGGKTISSFVHHIWVGDETRGLQWFAESDQGLAPVNNFVSIDSSKTMTLSLLGSKTISTNDPFHFVFGIMASPVKPAVAHDDVRWAWPAGRCDKYNHDYYGNPSSLEESYLHALYVTGVNVETMDGGAQAYGGASNFGDPYITNPDLANLIYYADPWGIGITSWAGVWLDPAISAFNYDTWRLVPRSESQYPEFTGSDPNAPGITLYPCCANSDWAKWYLDRAVRGLYELNLDGYYLDGNAVPQKCLNTQHGCGYTSGSTTKQTSPILATREMMKTLYLATDIAPGTGRKWIMAHISGSVFLPCLSFADAYLDGEQINGYPDSASPNPGYTIEGYRAEFMGHQYGVPAFYLGPDARRSCAYALLHGQSSYHLDPILYGWNTYRNFYNNYSPNIEWIPYWQSNRPITTSASDLKISTYKKYGSATYFVVANLSTTNPVTATINIDWAALGLITGARVHTMFLTGYQSGQVVSTYPTNPQLTIPAGDFGLILIDYN